MMKGDMWIRGRLIPITSVVGTVLAFVAWVVALGTHPGARVVGPLWMVAGLALYVAVRVRAGLPIIESVDQDASPPVDLTELAYSTIVVPLERLDAIAEETMASACRLAVDSGAVVVGVSAIYVPVREPIDQPMLEREREVEEVQALRGVAGLGVRRRVQGGGLAHAQPRAARRRRGGRVRRAADHGGVAVQTPSGPQPARGILRPDGRFHPPEGTLPGDRDALSGRSC